MEQLLSNISISETIDYSIRNSIDKSIDNSNLMPRAFVAYFFDAMERLRDGASAILTRRSTTWSKVEYIFGVREKKTL
jgi:hypothetical protein